MLGGLLMERDVAFLAMADACPKHEPQGRASYFSKFISAQPISWEAAALAGMVLFVDA